MASSLHLRFSSTPQQPLLPPPPSSSSSSSSSSVISITTSRRRLSYSVKQAYSRRSFPLISAFLFRIRRPISDDCCSLVTVRAAEESSSGIADDDGKEVPEKSVSVVLLAGGKGKRMGAPIPKQYLPLLGKPIALYSLYTFADLFEVKEIIVVCDPSYRQLFGDAMDEISVDVKFALPGKERQDSVFNGIQEMDQSSQLVCIHDSARPLVTAVDVQKVIKDGWLIGAAVLGVPVKATIKEAHRSFVVKTLDRKTLWEMQTPQVIRPQLLNDGFELVRREGLVVTDDVSIVEFLKHPVYITEGSYTNIKVTTPDDLLLAERIINLQADKNTVKAAKT